MKVTDEASATPVTTVHGSESAAEHAAARAGEPKPTVRKIDGPANEPIELSNLAGHAVMKRLLPAVGGLVLLLLVLRKLRRR